MTENTRTDEGGPSDDQDIMRRIEAHIIERREAAVCNFHQPRRVAGRFSQVQDHLSQAIDSSDKVRVQFHARTLRMPIVGAWLTRARGMFHRLVVYYVNQLAARQIHFNIAISRAFAALIQELDTGQQLAAADARIVELEVRVANLEARLDGLEPAAYAQSPIEEPCE